MRERAARPYQANACNNVFTLHNKGVRSTLIAMPTGTGKTVVAGKVLRRWAEEKRTRQLFLAHRIELLDQAADKIAPDLGYTPSIIQAAREINWSLFAREDSVMVGSIQTCSRQNRLDYFRQHPISHVYIDEAHRANARIYKRFIAHLRDINPDLQVTGTTATPRDKMDLFEEFAFRWDICDAMDEGWLVPVVERKIVVDDVDIEHVPMKTVDGEQDLDPVALEQLMIHHKAIQAVAQPLLDHSADRKWLVFGQGVKHCRSLAASLNVAKPGSAIAMDGETTPPGHPDRVAGIEAFRRGNIQFLVNYGIFTEGFDAPECSGVAIARFTKSWQVLMQMAGRGLRPADRLLDDLAASPARDRLEAIRGSIKPDCLILSYQPKMSSIRTYTMIDALGGNLDEETKKAAEDFGDDGDVRKSLKAALVMKDLEEDQKKFEKAKIRHQSSEREARMFKADVDYRVYDADYYGSFESNEPRSKPRGTSTDAQVKLLESLGVSHNTAQSFSKKQAGAVIENLKSTRCTKKQAAVLQRCHQNPADFNYDQASSYIERLSRNGWRPLNEAPT